MENNNFQKKDKRKRGLASANEETRKRVASQGGRAAQSSGHAHILTSDERSRGGKNSPGNFAKRPKDEVQKIGRKGGKSSGMGRKNSHADINKNGLPITG